MREVNPKIRVGIHQMSEEKRASQKEGLHLSEEQLQHLGVSSGSEISVQGSPNTSKSPGRGAGRMAWGAVSEE